MTRPMVTVPQSLLHQIDLDWRIDWRGQSAGEFNSGVSGTHYAGFPRWVGAPSFFMNAGELRKWRAISAHARGRTSVYRVRMFDPVAFDMDAAGASATVIATGKTTTDGNYFTNGKGWEYDPFCLCETAAEKGATTLRVDVASCNDVAPVEGQIMSVDLWPFTVTSVLPVGGTVYEIGISMALRTDVAVGRYIKMRGEGLFELIDGTGNPAYNANRFSRPQMEFVEALAR